MILRQACVGSTVLAGVAVLLAAVTSLAAQPVGWQWLLLAVLPLLGALYRTFRTSIRRAEDALRHSERHNSLCLGTVESLAMAIDAKDPGRPVHAATVRTLASGAPTAASERLAS